MGENATSAAAGVCANRHSVAPGLNFKRIAPAVCTGGRTRRGCVAEKGGAAERFISPAATLPFRYGRMFS